MTGDDARVIPLWEASSAGLRLAVAWVRQWFRCLKLAGLPVVTGVLSVGVVLFQRHERWIGRPAAEALKQERHLDQARARAFQGQGLDRLLAARVEELLTRESAGWSGSEQAVGRVPGASR